MNIEFIEPASIELDDAITYYDMQLQGLGKKFLEEILQTVNLISIFPEVWAKNSVYTRKAVLKKFPYNLIYLKSKGIIYIIAVAHQHREPEYWIDRIL
jgi:hypothetical protein